MTQKPDNPPAMMTNEQLAASVARVKELDARVLRVDDGRVFWWYADGSHRSLTSEDVSTINLLLQTRFESVSPYDILDVLARRIHELHGVCIEKGLIHEKY